MSTVAGLRVYNVGLGSPAAASWGPARAAAEGIAATNKPYPAGDDGVSMSLSEMARLMREARNDRDINGYAGQVLKAAGLDGRNRSTWTARTVAQALLDNVRSVTIYSPDPSGTEMIVSPAGQLCLRPGLCIQKGDCDDLTVLLGALCMSVGLEARIVKQSWGADQQQHVLLAVKDESGQWLKCDPSHASLPVGRGVPASEEVMIDPLDATGKIGTAGAEIVTFGALPHDVGVGAFVSDDEALALIQQTSALMDSTNSSLLGCAQMLPTDIQAWNGVYVGWGTWLASLNGCLDDTFPSIHTACAPFYTLSEHWAKAKQGLLGYQATATAWQTKIKTACPAYQPTPPLPVPVPLPPDSGGGGSSGGIVSDVKATASIIGGTALLLVLAYAGYKAVQVVSGLAPRKVGA